VRPLGPSATRGLAALAGAVVFAVAASAGVGAYTVRPGDTLSGIATRHGVSVRDLTAANGITDPNRIYAGRQLRIPGGNSAGGGSDAPAGTIYVVRQGDALSTIASRHGVTLRALADANDIVDVHLIRIGSRLVIPPSDLAATASRGGSTGSAATSRFPAKLQASPSRSALVPVFQHWSTAYGAPADLLMALTWLESGWQNHVVSPVGAVGIGQLMPATSEFVSDVLLRTSLDPRVPEHNVRMSARFLRWLLDRTGGDQTLALAAYYQGLASVRARGVLPSSAAYARDVLAIRARHFAA